MSVKEKFQKFLEERLPVQAFKDLSSHKMVPEHKQAFWYYFGGITLFFFIILVFTGMVLLFQYQPGLESSHASVLRIVTKVDFGWLIRSIHSWGANLMLAAAFIHMFSVYFMKAYQKPRELTWLTGLGLLGLGMGLGFTGYSLVWDDMAFFATKIGIDMMEGIPGGEYIADIIRGGPEMGGLTIQRMFALHVVILPWIFIGLLGAHLFFLQIHGNKIPEGIEKSGEYRKVPFFPNFIFSDLYVWLICLNLLAVLAAMYPWHIGAEADPLAPSPKGIKPEWYFMAMFQLLKLMPAHVAGMSGELFGNMLFGAAAMFWAAVPVWNPAGTVGRRAKLATYVGLLGLMFIIGFTIWGYTAHPV
ncbi:cytochrome bc complex cytochrome b subunit [bacterium]|nr:cytochrome bc complex cytochrome b subunit [bacterium]